MQQRARAIAIFCWGARFVLAPPQDPMAGKVTIGACRPNRACGKPQWPWACAVKHGTFFEKSIAMSEASPRPELPDHLSIDPRSPHHVAAVFEQEIGIRFNDKERYDVEEYCISEGWVRVPAGKALDRKGKPLLIKIKGRVEAFYR
jgi:hypothetical protein